MTPAEYEAATRVDGEDEDEESESTSIYDPFRYRFIEVRLLIIHTY